MKTGLKTGLFTLAFAVLASCGSDDADASGINTADVKGDIDLMGENGHSLNLNNNGEESKAYQIEIGETAELTIFPSSVTFEEEKEKIMIKVQEQQKEHNEVDIHMEVDNDKHKFYHFHNNCS